MSMIAIPNMIESERTTLFFISTSKWKSYQKTKKRNENLKTLQTRRKSFASNNMLLLRYFFSFRICRASCALATSLSMSLAISTAFATN